MLFSKEFDKEVMQLVLNYIHGRTKESSYVDNNGNIIIGELLELHFSEDKTCIDIYKYASQEDMEAEDYDFDGDYITTINLKEN